MEKSLFRRIDRIELLCCYALCFLLNTLFDYAKTLQMDSYFLQAFLKQLYDYQAVITFLFSFIVVIFHYQMLQRRKIEVHCRILVGDTISSITKRHCCECLMILGVVFVVTTILTLAMKIDIIHNIYLLCVFVLYVLISSWMVNKFENI